MHNWKTKKIESLGKFKIFEIFKEIVENPRNNHLIDFYYLKQSNWTVVIPITNNNEYVLVKQFRIGAKKVFYEFPGGLIDKGEEPINAAKRELLEETGYTAKNFKLITETYPLPAFQTSKCFIFAAENAKFSQKISLDPGEQIETVILNENQVIDLILTNNFDNAIMMLSFLIYKFKKSLK